MPKCKKCLTYIPKPGVICEACYVEELEADLHSVMDKKNTPEQMAKIKAAILQEVGKL